MFKSFLRPRGNFCRCDAPPSTGHRQEISKTLDADTGVNYTPAVLLRRNGPGGQQRDGEVFEE